MPVVCGMNTGDALLRAILLNPAEDTPRLVYADYLEDANGGNDAARAEFIRVQVELARRNVKRGEEDEDTWALTCRACDLLRDGGISPDHIGSAPRFKERPFDYGNIAVEYESESGADANPSLLFSRGMLAAVAVPLAAFMDEAKGLFTGSAIEYVRLIGAMPQSTRHMSRGRGRRVTWFNRNAWGGQSRGRPSELPAELMTTPAERRKNFYAASDAFEWLSARCVAYGRSLAGLTGSPVGGNDAA